MGRAKQTRQTIKVTIGDDPTFGELYSIDVRGWMSLPTLSVGQEADLKYDGERYRVWIGRSHGSDWDGDAKGYTDSRVQFEELVDGRWVSLDRYGKRGG